MKTLTVKKIRSPSLGRFKISQRVDRARQDRNNQNKQMNLNLTIRVGKARKIGKENTKDKFEYVDNKREKSCH